MTWLRYDREPHDSSNTRCWAHAQRLRKVYVGDLIQSPNSKLNQEDTVRKTTFRSQLQAVCDSMDLNDTSPDSADPPRLQHDASWQHAVRLFPMDPP